MSENAHQPARGIETGYFDDWVAQHLPVRTPINPPEGLKLCAAGSTDSRCKW